MAPRFDNSSSDSTLMVADHSLPLPHNVQFAKIARSVINFYSTTDMPPRFQNNQYYQPRSTDFPLFDAFTVEFDNLKNLAILWVLQITTSRSHGGSATGYQVIHKIVSTLKGQLREAPHLGT